MGNKLWTNWNKAPMRLWQMQLNFGVFCALSACGISSEHLNYTKHSMIRAVYRFHIYYHVRQVLKKLQVPLPHESSFNAADNPYTSEEFFKICEDYGVPNDPMRYRDEKFYWRYQRGTGCWLLAAGCWLLAAGCWLLAAGCWLLAAGCWLLAAG